MVYLLLGKDSFSKRHFVEDLRAKNVGQLFEFDADSEPKEIFAAIENSSLFASSKFVLLNNLATKISPAELITKTAKQSSVVYLEDSLDGRKTETKNILKTVGLQVEHFDIPIGDQLRRWVEKQAAELDLQFSKPSLNEFLQRIGINDDPRQAPIYDLWQIDNELRKLKTFAGDQQLQPEQISVLVAENADENIFLITNAIADKDKPSAVKYLRKYIQEVEGGDEKGAILNLSAIMAEQFRNIIIVQQMLAERKSEQQIISQTGFSSGRLFMQKKLATRFERAKLLDALRKFELLDREIKSSTSPAELQFYMIINSAIG